MFLLLLVLLTWFLTWDETINKSVYTAIALNMIKWINPSNHDLAPHTSSSSSSSCPFFIFSSFPPFFSSTNNLFLSKLCIPFSTLSIRKNRGKIGERISAFEPNILCITFFTITIVGLIFFMIYFFLWFDKFYY